MAKLTGNVDRTRRGLPYQNKSQHEPSSLAEDHQENRPRRRNEAERSVLIGGEGVASETSRWAAKSATMADEESLGYETEVKKPDQLRTGSQQQNSGTAGNGKATPVLSNSERATRLFIG